ncbi:MAG: hypothetical protein ACBZ72_02880 [Candidatus Bathyarchaeia archaeon]|jgi:hypothetical protein
MNILKVVTCAEIAIFFVAFATFPVAWANSTISSTAIAEVKKSLNECFIQTQNAEQAGANVTSLLTTLNGASELLEEAELAQSRNNTDAAYDLVIESQTLLSGFKAQVNSAVEASNSEKSQSFQLFLISLIGSLTVLGLGAAGWMYIDRKNRGLEEQNHERSSV